MSNALSLLIEDYDCKKELKHIDLKLAQGKELRVFYRPVLNVDQQSKILKHFDMQTGGIDTEIFLTSLLVRALNEDGTRMFSDAEKNELRTKVDHSVLQEAFSLMGGALESIDPKQ